MDEGGSVSVIIINWNHQSYLKSCLTALKAQKYPDLEIVVVDNGSSDGSVGWIERNHRDVRLIAFPDNRGFAPAFNHAVRLTSSELLLSLNPDVTVQPGFIPALVRVMRQDDRIGIVAPKLRMTDQPDRIDSTGLFINRARRPYDRGQGEIDRGQYDQQTDIFGACGAAALYRRRMLTELAIDGQYFDDDFFAYYEDADLSWRAQLHGWRCVFSPEAVGNHQRGSGDTLRKRKAKVSQGPRLALRNRYLMTIKNDDPGAILSDLPVILAAEIPRLLYTAVATPKTLLGLVDLVKAWPKARSKRRKNLATRIIKPSELRHWFCNN
jgi:GT2 family glycosyltransferase